MAYLTWLIVGYAFGSIPFAVIIAKTRGVDIFKCGSGNPGATNVMRSVGKWEGRLCFALDAIKGFVPVAIPLAFSYVPFSAHYAPNFACTALVGALLGHSFSIWIKFRGGKGVATTVGGLFALVPAVMAGGVLLWLVTFYLSRYVSLASILMALWLPFGAWVFRADKISLFLVSFIGFLIILRHGANIGRLISGTENQFGGK